MHLGKLWASDLEKELMSDLNLETIHKVESYLESFGVTKESLEIWGSGKPMREFLWSEDMADACVFLMESRNFDDTYPKGTKEIRNTYINIGTGKDISIKDLALLVKDCVGYQGELVFNSKKPDGTLKKLTNVNKLESLGWKHKVDLTLGSYKLYSWYQQNYNT